MSIQPTTPAPLAKVLHGYFDTVNELNDKMAETLNELLPANPNEMDKVYPPTLASYEELDFCVRDLRRVIADERARIAHIELGPIFLAELLAAQQGTPSAAALLLLEGVRVRPC